MKQRSRVSFLILLIVIIGTGSIITLSWSFLVVPDLKKIPVDFHSIDVHEGQNQIVKSWGKPLTEPFILKEVTTQKVTNIDGDVLTIESKVIGRDVKTDEIVFRSTETFLVDRTTRHFIDDNYGLFNLPSNVEKTNYAFTDTFIPIPLTLVFDSIDSISGLTVYVFECEIDEFDDSELFPQFAPRKVLFEGNCKRWVEPITGDTLRYEQNWVDYVIENGQRIPVDVGEKYSTPEDILQHVEIAKNKSQLYFFYDTVMLIVLSLITIGLPMGIFVQRVSHSKSLEKVYRELQISDSKYRSLYEESPDLYRTINKEGIILDCNKSYAEKLGYTKQEIIGKPIFDHVMEEGKHALIDSFETWKKTGNVLNKEVWLKRKDGTSFPVLINASSLYDENGKLIGSNTIIRDISELRMMKKEVAYLKQKRLALLGELASQVAHDLRNPLSVIKNAIELIKLKSEPKVDEKTKTALERVDRAVNRMSHQIEDVLDFVKVQPLNYETATLSNIIKDAVPENVAPNIKINLPNDDITLMCDTRKLEAAFTNLISNAIDAVGDSGVIDVKVTDNEKHIQIEFQNSGPEIPKDTIPKIFDPLFTTKQVGTGLGLSSAKLIVEQQGGEINVRNNPTTFVITLPKEGNQKNHNNI